VDSDYLYKRSRPLLKVGRREACLVPLLAPPGVRSEQLQLFADTQTTTVFLTLAKATSYRKRGGTQ
jgi:hypothetical protein